MGISEKVFRQAMDTCPRIHEFFDSIEYNFVEESGNIEGSIYCHEQFRIEAVDDLVIFKGGTKLRLDAEMLIRLGEFCSMIKHFMQLEEEEVKDPSFETEDEKVVNIILNLSSGLEPINLSKQECKLLEKKYGSDWFEKIGYDETTHKKPDWSD